jgi:hypothetical protein
MQTPLTTSAVEEATLFVLGGADHVHLRADSSLTELFEATFDGPQPTVRRNGHLIEIENRWHPHLNWRRQTADIRLSPTVAWHIVVRGGLSDLRADLLGLRLAGFRIEGGVSRADLRLDEPVGQVPIHVSGGASHLTVVRRPGTAASITVGGGAIGLTLDAQHFGAIGGPARLETPNYQQAADRVDFRVEGGASHVALVAA